MNRRKKKRPSSKRPKPKGKLTIEKLDAIIDRQRPATKSEIREPKPYMFDVPLTRRRLEKPEKSARRKAIEARREKRARRGKK